MPRETFVFKDLDQNESKVTPEGVLNQGGRFGSIIRASLEGDSRSYVYKEYSNAFAEAAVPETIMRIHEMLSAAGIPTFDYFRVGNLEGKNNGENQFVTISEDLSDRGVVISSNTSKYGGELTDSEAKAMRSMDFATIKQDLYQLCTDLADAGLLVTNDAFFLIYDGKSTECIVGDFDTIVKDDGHPRYIEQQNKAQARELVATLKSTIDKLQ